MVINLYIRTESPETEWTCQLVVSYLPIVLFLFLRKFDFQFGQVEIVAACLIEHYPRKLSRFRELVVLVLCVLLFLMGLSCVTNVSWQNGDRRDCNAIQPVLLREKNKIGGPGQRSLEVPRPRSEVGRFTFKHRAAFTWNLLVNHGKNSNLLS